jgi:outer membrane protein assembly factor BamB
MKPPSLPVLAAFLLVFTLPGTAADWMQFRGPRGLGIAVDTNLPSTWSSQENILWKAELPGAGASSPIVVSNKIFLTCYSGYGQDQRNPGDVKDLKRLLVCLERNGGKVLWSRTLRAPMPEPAFEGFTALHGYASSTPASDGQRVYVFFGKAGVIAFDLEGKQLWQASVGQGTHGWGSGTSPVLTKDLVIVNASVESGSLQALNKSNGKVAWTAKGMSASWNTPVLVDMPNGKQELVVSVQGRLRAFNPQTGKELWNCQGVNDYVCPSVVAHEGVVYVIGGRSNTAIAVKAGGQGDVSKTHQLWRISRGSNVSSPVYHEGHLYWANESRGVVYCVNIEKGTVIFEERLQPISDRIYASPVAADGKLYFVSRNNGTYVLEAKPDFKLLAHNTIKDDTSVFNASPVISNGQILLRSNRYLYCIGPKS